MIAVTDLCKTFKLYSKPRDRLREALGGRARHTLHHALKRISFEVAEGEVLGVLGRNGAGKSTLLKLLTGVLLPDDGTMQIEGRITGLLELGTGFNPDLSGMENITANGLMLGMSRREIEARREVIVEFSELGDYIHEPLRTYSSGMIMRLGFAVAIHADPACFLVDEALSVGDGYFQQKCMKRIREFKEAGGSILFVSHDLNAVKMLCDRAIVLEDGEIVCAAAADDAVNHYNRIMSRQAEEEESRYQERHHGVYGSREVEVVKGRLEGRQSGTEMLSSGDELVMTLMLAAHRPVEDLTLGIMIRDRFGQDIFGVNSHQLGQSMSLSAHERREISMSIKVDLAPGKYTVTIALHSGEHHMDDCYWWCDGYRQFEIAGFGAAPFGGICRLPVSLALEGVPSTLPSRSSNAADL